jgi:hypothetical protein
VPFAPALFETSDVSGNRVDGDFVPLIWYEIIAGVNIIPRCQHIAYAEV